MSRAIEALRLLPRIPGIWRLATREAEALVLAHGAAGVETAREIERVEFAGPLPVRFHGLVLRAIAERRQEHLEGLDTATRYEVVARWRGRQGA